MAGPAQRPWRDKKLADRLIVLTLHWFEQSQYSAPFSFEKDERQNNFYRVNDWGPTLPSGSARAGTVREQGASAPESAETARTVPAIVS